MLTQTVYLTQHHREHLLASAISEEVIAERGYRTVTRKEDLAGLELLQSRVPGLLIPVYRLGEVEPYTHVLRPDNPRKRDGKTIKYEWPMGVPLVLDVLPRYRQILGNPAVPLWFTEGAKKADALASRFGQAVVPVNLNGVYGWRSTNAFGGKTALPDFEEVAFNGREVVLAFDSDIVRKREVVAALRRLASYLSSKGAEVKALYLPEPNGNKLGVDDALALGYDPLDYLQPLESEPTRKRLGAHPETGNELFLPKGYGDEGGRLVRMVGDQPRQVYPGILVVTALGADLDSGDQTLTVTFEGGGGQRVTVTAPRSELSRAKGVLDRLAARGAAVSEANAKEVAAYLVAFAHENREALPYHLEATRMGLHRDASMLVLPGGVVGGEFKVSRLASPVRVGNDREAYRRVLEEASRWENAWAFWTALGLSLASPMIRRDGVRRNPLLYLAGESGTGKTTLAQFAVGVWGDPTRNPFRLEAGRTTVAGYLQTLEHLGGLPLFVDEAHTAGEGEGPLERLVYQFANGETYTRGGVDGRARGGGSIGGTLILAGEALPSFRHHGAQRRVLWLEGQAWPPLGRLLAADRASLLENAWTAGAGLLGHAVAQEVWQDWEGYRVAQREFARRFQALPTPWNAIFAHTMTALGYVCQALELPYPETFQALPERWGEMLGKAQNLSDPSAKAWEALASLITASSADEGDFRRLGGELVAWRGIYNGQAVWFVPTNTRSFRERLGENAVQLHGKTWVERGLILPNSDGKSTVPRRVEGVQVRVLAVVQEAEDV